MFIMEKENNAIEQKIDTIDRFKCSFLIKSAVLSLIETFNFTQCNRFVQKLFYWLHKRSIKHF